VSSVVEVLGRQEPRLHVVPPYVESAGGEAIEIAELAGLFLDPWEKLVLRDALGEMASGRWAAFRVGLEVARQNGKGAVLCARELGGLFAFGERLIIHSAHEQATASEHFERMLALMEGVPEFERRILKVVRGKGSESIKLRDNYRIFFKTRTGGGGRGFTGDLVVFDEAMMLAAAFMAALVPLMAARSMDGDPQLWFAGSAVDQQKTAHGVEFARVRADALAAVERLAYFGWSAPFDDPSNVPREVLDDPEMWALANPGLGIRISPQYIADERGALGSREFAVERLGIGDWPSTDEYSGRLFAPGVWQALTDVRSSVCDPVCFAVDVSPDRSSAAIGAAGRRADGQWHVEVVDHRKGTEWVVPRTAALLARHSSVGPVVDGVGPAAALAPEFAEAGVELRMTKTQEYVQACGQMYDSAMRGTLRHLGTDDLAQAVDGAARRPLGDAWALSRKDSQADITPLVSVTLARWGAETLPLAVDASQNIW
jgi:hypothetical protein